MMKMLQYILISTACAFSMDTHFALRTSENLKLYSFARHRKFRTPKTIVNTDIYQFIFHKFCYIFQPPNNSMDYCKLNQKNIHNQTRITSLFQEKECINDAFCTPKLKSNASNPYRILIKNKKKIKRLEDIKKNQIKELLIVCKKN